MTLITFVLLFINVFLYSKCSNVSDTTAFVANSDFALRRTTLVAWRSYDSTDVSDFLQKYAGAVITSRIHRKMKNNFKSYRQYVFFATNISEFEIIFNKTLNKLRVQSILTILVLAQDTQESELRMIFETAWNNGMGDILTINSMINDTEVLLQTFYPYTDGDCNNFTPVRVDIKKRAASFFPKKYINFHKCQVRVSAFHYLPYVSINENAENDVDKLGGVNGNFIKMAMDILNATIVLQIPENLTDTESFLHDNMIDHESDVNALSLTITAKTFRLGRPSRAYQVIQFVWCAPVQQEIYHWATLLHPVFSHLTYCFALFWCLFLILCVVAEKLRDSALQRYLFFKIFGMFLGQTMKFEGKDWLMKGILIWWVWFCMIIRIFYSGLMVKGLQDIYLEPPLNTLEEALKRVDTVAGTSIIYRLYQNASFAKQFQVYKMNEIGHYLEQITQGRKMLLGTDSVILYTHGKKVQVVGEAVAFAPASYFLRRRWAPGVQIDKLLVRLIEHGFENQLQKEYFNLFFIHSNYTRAWKNLPLDLPVLGACFYGLILLWIISCLVFAYEVISFKRNLRENDENKNN